MSRTFGHDCARYATFKTPGKYHAGMAATSPAARRWLKVALTRRGRRLANAALKVEAGAAEWHVEVVTPAPILPRREVAPKVALPNPRLVLIHALRKQCEESLKTA